MQKISFCPTPQRKFFASEQIRFWSVSARPAAERRGGQLFFLKIFDKISLSVVVNILKISLEILSVYTTKSEPILNEIDARAGREGKGV